MLDKKVVVIVVVLMLFGATMALGAANVIANGSGIVAGTKPAVEAELIIGQSGTPANILVVTQANEYCFRGTVIDITGYDSNHIRVSGTIAGDGTFDAIASKTNDPNIWTLQITGDVVNNGKCDIPVTEPLTLNGHLQIIPP